MPVEAIDMQILRQIVFSELRVFRHNSNGQKNLTRARIKALNKRGKQ